MADIVARFPLDRSAIRPMTWRSRGSSPSRTTIRRASSVPGPARSTRWSRSCASS